ncbi:cell division protein FtsA [Thiotrichales bacterium 19X7-9]|nr:cell division protein FtsA [Thiotrichales bacterium 19X7-9]TNF65173.1 MAG: cell division protein FtsA [Gammaproteobacteria bacterium]UTW41794.1 cell division protein FtsA [bacterium SCSIO 12844]
MSREPDKQLLTALDIGTSKVVAIVAEVNEGGRVNIIGFGTQPSKGLKKGVIVNIDATVKAIQKAIEEAEHMADCEIGSVCVGIAGSHINSFDSTGVVAIRNSEVYPDDVERVIDAAKAVPLPADQRIIHILPQDFLIDGQGGIKEPVGISGVRLEAKVHMVTGSISAVQNIVKCVNRCGIEVSDVVLEQLASSYAVLTEDEKELGACLVDIGGGTSDIAVFLHGAIRHTKVIPIAGAQVTNDLAHALRIPTDVAEEVKINYGNALMRTVRDGEVVEVPDIAGRTTRRLPAQTLASVVEARCEELLTLIYEDLNKKGLLDQLAAGIILTGGAAKMRGLIELAEEVFRVPVRLGVPQYVTGLSDIMHNPMHATGAGLLLYSQSQQTESMPFDSDETDRDGIWRKMTKWFSNHF